MHPGMHTHVHAHTHTRTYGHTHTRTHTLTSMNIYYKALTYSLVGSRTRHHF